MKTYQFSDRESWLDFRRGKITGSRLKDIIVKRGSGHKAGFYEVIAERVAVVGSWEDPMERGSRLEPEAIEMFSKVTKKKVDTSLVIWTRDENESIAVSPDGFIGKTEAVEAKCLSSAQHIKAWLTKEVPDEYEEQKIQYFVVNEKLKKLYFAFYDPRIPAKEFFVIEIDRKDIQEKVDEYLAYQIRELQEIDEAVKSFSF